jgi:hypothetical protein
VVSIADGTRTISGVVMVVSSYFTVVDASHNAASSPKLWLPLLATCNDDGCDPMKENTGTGRHI